MVKAGELLELEHAWANAFRGPDLEFLESLLAPDFRLSFADDPRAPLTFSREQWFDRLKLMSFGTLSISTSQESVFANVGVVQMRARFEDWRFEGTLLPAEYDLTDVFVRRDGRWQVVNRISEGVSGSPTF